MFYIESNEQKDGCNHEAKDVAGWYVIWHNITTFNTFVVRCPFICKFWFISCINLATK